VRRGRHALEVELGDPLDVLEHLGELGGHPLDLQLGQLEPGETGDVEHLSAIQHGPKSRTP